MTEFNLIVLSVNVQIKNSHRYMPCSEYLITFITRSQNLHFQCMYFYILQLLNITTMNQYFFKKRQKKKDECLTYPPPPPTHHRRPPRHSSGCCTSWTPPDSLSHSRQGRTGQRCPLALSCKQTSPSSANTNSVTFNKDKLHTVLLPNMTLFKTM